MFARDPGIVDPAMRAVDDGLSAIEAILASTDDQAAILAAVDDEYFQARAADVRDVGRRVAGIISGASRPDLWHADGRPAVIVADDLDPSAVATLRPELVAGIALAGGAPTGHASIVARGLGIALVLGLGAGVADAADGAAALVDAGDPPIGRLVIEPDASDLAALGAAPTPSNRPTGSGLAVGPGRARRRRDRDGLRECRLGARGGRGAARPGRRASASSGPSSSSSAAGRRRPLPSSATSMPGSANGWEPGRSSSGRSMSAVTSPPRGRRIAPRRTRPSASAACAWAWRGPTSSTTSSARWSTRPPGARSGSCCRWSPRSRRSSPCGPGWTRSSTRRHAPPSAVLLGVMIEVPAAALVADGLAEVADFFSIGTNDLVQYTLAADRVNPALAELASALQPAVLRLIGAVVDRRAPGGVTSRSAARPRRIWRWSRSWSGWVSTS